MSQYLPEPRNGLFPSRVNRRLSQQLEQMDAQAVVAQHADQLSIARAVQTAAHGIEGVAFLSMIEASKVQQAPHAEGRLRMVADTASFTIANIVARSGS
jgi:hypothetical protein